MIEPTYTSQSDYWDEIDDAIDDQEAVYGQDPFDEGEFDTSDPYDMEYDVP